MAAVRRDKLWGFINSQGHMIIFPAYQTNYNFKLKFKEKLAAVKKEDKYGYINSNGAIIIPFKYLGAEPFYYGKAAVKVENRWGFINAFGE